uniref:RING-type domain-containing protein n=1 Tax=Malurus cyaneus samueli TaxID=2593467 RepID=A0A8C5TWQ5_9PASS
MATETGGNGAICQDTWDDVASALPCGHRFCQGCILRWARTNPSCPLCRGAIETLRFSDDAGDLLSGSRLFSADFIRHELVCLCQWHVLDLFFY